MLVFSGPQTSQLFGNVTLYQESHALHFASFFPSSCSVQNPSQPLSVVVEAVNTQKTLDVDLNDSAGSHLSA